MARDPATDTDALVAASAVVFGRMGYRNATIDDIAAAAGISRPTVYKYTKTKRHLLDLMVKQVTDYLAGPATAALDSNAAPSERLRSLLRVHIESACANSEFYRIILREQVELSAPARKRFREWERVITHDLTAVLDECVEPAGGSGEIDTGVVANLVLSMTTALPNWYVPQGSIDTEGLLRYVLGMLEGVIPGLRSALSAQ